MKIKLEDKALVDAFIHREMDDYDWLDDILFGKTMLRRKADFFDLTWAGINKLIEPIESADFICIQSLTNMGLVQRSVTVTPDNWDHKPGTYEIWLPSSPPPRGGVNGGFKNK